MRVAKWGSSLAIRLPAAVVEALGPKAGDKIEIRIDDGGEFAVSRKSGHDELLRRLRRFRGRLPADFKFDREAANSRQLFRHRRSSLHRLRRSTTIRFQVFGDLAVAVKHQYPVAGLAPAIHVPFLQGGSIARRGRPGQARPKGSFCFEAFDDHWESEPDSCAGDRAKAERAGEPIAAGGVISVQVLNEFSNVARRMMGLLWSEARAFLSTLRRQLTVRPLTVAVHELGLDLAERYHLSVYDADRRFGPRGRMRYAVV